MGKKQILTTLPEGEYISEKPKVVKTLPEGDYSLDGKKLIEGFNPNVLFEESPQQKLDRIAETIPYLDDTKRSIWKDLVLKGTNKQDLVSSLVTLQGKNAKQEGVPNYYYNEKGIPIPLAPNERPPKGFDIANDYHGTQEDANKDGFFVSAGKHIYNGVIKGVLGLEGLANLPYALATGEDADWYKGAKNRVESSLYKRPEYEQEGQLFDAKDMKSVGDFFDPKRYDFSKNTVQGAVLNGLESVVSFMVGTKGIGAAGTAMSAIGKGSKVLSAGSKTGQFLEGGTASAQRVQAFGGAYAMSVSEILDYVDESGITGREKYALAASIAVPFALTEMLFGTEGAIVKNTVAKNAKTNLIKGLVDGVKDATEGKVTKEALESAFKATTVEATKLNKSLLREAGESIAEEGLTEAVQEFEKRGLAKLYDIISKEDNFKDNPLSLDAFGEYYNSALSGAAGAMGPGTASTIQSRKLEVKKKQDENVYNTVKKGPEAVESLKINIAKAVQNGEITTDQATQIETKLNAYSVYNENLKNTNLSPEEERRVFDLTYEKAALDFEIPTDYKAEQLNAIQQAQIEVKKKQAKNIQEEINKIILRDDVVNKAETTAEKTNEEVESEVQKQLKKYGIKVQEGEGAISEGSVESEGGYKVPEVVLKETRNYDEIDVPEWNDPKFNTRIKQYKLAEAIDALPEKSTQGVLDVDNEYTAADGHKVQTFNVTLPDGKSVRFASSMVRRPDEKAAGGFRGNTYEENFSNRENPVGQKVGVTVKTLTDSGRKVLFIWNAETGEKYGKHIGMIKESLRGNSGYSEADLEEMADLRMTNMGLEGGKTTGVEQPIKPVVPSKSREQQKKEYVQEKIKRLKATGESNYLPSLTNVYNELFGREFEKFYPEEAEIEEAVSEKEPVEKRRKAVVKKQAESTIKELMKKEPEAFEEAVLQFFLGAGKRGGKIKTSDFIRYTGFGGKNERTGKTKGRKEFNQYIWAHKRDGKPVDLLVKELWKDALGLPDDAIDEQELINRFFEVLLDNPGKNSMMSNLAAMQKENMEAAKGDINIPGLDEYIKELEAAEEYFYGQQRDLTEEEIKSLNEEEAARLEAEKELGEEEDDTLQKTSKSKGDIDKVVSRLKKSMPGIKVVYDESLNAAGKWSPKNKTITINPFYAGIDTPIHEYGHVLIDAIGYNNKVIQSAIKQLKDTDLWKETKKRYPELNEEGLAKEVLAEAIGTEGAGIFDKEADKSKFKQYLDYIFDWFKTKLGLNKNIAKSLAKQVISGVGVKDITEDVKGKEISLQLPSGERVNGVEVMPEVIDGFYSKLEKQLLQMKLDKAPAKQWNDKLKGEEAKWTGLNDWLAEKGQQPVTRQEIKDFLKNNRISLIEINKGRKGKASEQDLKDNIEAEGYELEFDMGGEGYMILDQEGEIAEYDDLPDNVRNWYDELAEVTNPDETIGTKYSQYQLEGEKENYKEVLVTMPTKRQKAKVVEVDGKWKIQQLDGSLSPVSFTSKPFAEKALKEYIERERSGERADKETFKSTHFEESNILVHLRMNERTDAEGNKVLFLEEVQSDWGQQGKREGFENNLINEHNQIIEQILKLEKKPASEIKNEYENNTEMYFKEIKSLKEKAKAIDQKIPKEYERSFNGFINNKSTPSAPFVTDTNAWVKLGLKYALKQAVESGATKIAWTTGEQQNERYDLSKQVDEISYFYSPSREEYDVSVIKDGNTLETKTLQENELEANFGKDVAKRIIEGEGKEYSTGLKSLTGIQLSVGGKGMKGFYDKILPDVFKALVKELSGKTGELSSVNILTSESKYDSEYRDIIKKFEQEGNVESAEYWKNALKENQRERQINQMAIDITPELAQSVSSGMPMFQKAKEGGKPKRKPKTLEELSMLELEKETKLRPRQFIANNLGVDLTERKKDIETAKERIADPKTPAAEKKQWELLLAEIAKREKREIGQYYQYLQEFEAINAIASDSEAIKNKSINELAAMYNDLLAFSEDVRGRVFNTVREQLAYKLFVERKNELNKAMKEGKVKGFIEEIANKKDIHAKDVLMKTLSHMTENTPELQKFSKMFDSSHFDMTEERYDLKNELEKLGKAVIEEKNAKLGILGKAKTYFSSDNAKYFEYLENPKAIKNDDGSYSPGYWTVEEAKAKGFSKAQIDFLKYMRKLNDLRNQQLLQKGDQFGTEEVLKVDRGVMESFKEEGLLQALSAYLGNGYNVKNIRIEYKDPKAGKKSIQSYGDIEKALIKYGKESPLQKANAIKLMVKYQFAARRQMGTATNVDEKENPLGMKVGSEYTINPYGALDNKFLKPRDKSRGYSRDFYRAAFTFIDDYTHSKHMSKLLPYIDSIQYLNDKGYAEHVKKENVVKWIEDWKDMHIFKTDKPGKLGPEVDSALRFLRTLTSQIVMAFNIPAGVMNIFIGQYNNWRAKSGLSGGLGHKRLFSGLDRGEGVLGKAVNKKAYDILKKYQVVSVDYDSNPKLFAGRLFDYLAHGLTRLGEFYIQGSMFLGQMTDSEFDSFEYKKNENGVEELVLKPGVDEKAFKNKMIAYKNRVSDVQGKYGEKDRRNFMNGELGKTIAQFKVWVPDWWKERFGAKYITADGTEHMGSWRTFMGDALYDLRQQVKEAGPKALFTSNTKEAIAFRQNLKGAMMVAAMLAIRLGADDDEKKRRDGDLVSRMLGDLFFIFNPDQLRFTVKSPVAIMGTVSKLIDIMDYALPFEDDDFYKSDGRFGKKGDSKLWGASIQVIPHNKLLINDLIFPREK